MGEKKMPALRGRELFGAIWEQIRDVPNNQMSSLERQIKALLREKYGEVRFCDECGKEYIPVQRRQRFHSGKCSTRWWHRVYRARKKKIQNK